MAHTQKRTLALALIAAVAATVALAPEARADRRSSLGGNLLIEDHDDVFIFPHTALKHTRLITLDLALDGNDSPFGTRGSAGLIFGDTGTAIGVFAHRADTLTVIPTAFNTFGDIDTINLDINPGLFPSTDGGLLPPLQWIDGVFAMDLGGGSSFGVRLSLSHNQNNSEDANGDNVNVNDNSTTAINLVVGYGMSGDLNLDISAELGFGFQSILVDPNGDNNNQETSANNLPSIAVLARGSQNLAKGVELGFLGKFEFLAFTNEVTQEANDEVGGTAANTLSLDIGAGPVYHVDDKFNIAAYAIAGIRRTSADPSINSDDQNDETTNILLTLPALRLAGEFRVFDWLWLRTGAQFGYAFSFTETLGGEADISQSTSTTVSAYRWISGVGVDLGDLQLNGTFNHAFMLEGPNFIGGGEDMFAMLNVLYNFN